MRTVGRVAAAIQLLQHPVDLGKFQLLVGPDGAVACHENQTRVNGFFKTRRKTDLGHLFHHLDDQRFNCSVFEKCRNRFNHKSIPAKGFYFQSQFIQIRNQFLKNFRFPVSEIEGFRDEKYLGRRS